MIQPRRGEGTRHLKQDDTKDNNMVQCRSRKRWAYLEETLVLSLEEAEGKECKCNLCMTRACTGPFGQSSQRVSGGAQERRGDLHGYAGRGV